MRLTQRQVQALWRQTYLQNSVGARIHVKDFDDAPLTRDEMHDLEARLYVAAHPELVQRVIDLDVEQ